MYHLFLNSFTTSSIVRITANCLTDKALSCVPVINDLSEIPTRDH